MKHHNYANLISLAATLLIAIISIAIASHYEDAAWQSQGRANSLALQNTALCAKLDELSALDTLPAGMIATYAGEFTLTSYCCERYPHICGTGDGITASGAPVNPGLTVAADLSVLPLGTVVYITGVGVRVVQDTGGGLQGNHLDVAVEGTHEDALSWPLGMTTQKVWILRGDRK